MCGRLRALVVGLIALSHVGCAVDEEVPATVSGQGAQTWAVATDPVLVIGEEGSRDYQFNRVVSVGRIDAQGWVVADGGSREIRYYSDRGRFVRSVGGFGEGPGEFVDLTFARVVGEREIVAFDQRQQRVSVWTSEGRLNGTSVPSQDLSQVVGGMIGFVDPGIVVFAAISYPDCVEGEIVFDSVAYNAASFDVNEVQFSDPITPLGQFPRAAGWGNRFNLGGLCLRTPIEFSPRPLPIAGAGQFHVALATHGEIASVDLRSGQTARDTLRTIRRELTPGTINQFIDRELGREQVDENGAPLPRGRGWTEYAQRLRETPYPDSLPAFDQALVDKTGWVWLRSFGLPEDTVATWMAWDPSSRHVREVMIPSGFRPLEIGQDYLAGTWTDEFGIERVQILALDRGEPNPES